ncbi:MAG TPA: hypothetical protein DHW82_13815 [Spirochaetia bacterium]|nr:hypothetical protein [Spirochaetia bacterium]
MNLIYTVKNLSAIPDTKKIGGKARNLALLSAKAIPVPDWMALSVDFFEKFMGSDLEPLKKLLSAKISNAKEIKPLSLELESLILKKNFSGELKTLIETTLKETFGETETLFYAVRSSATDEDSKNFSFAGQLESFLYLKHDSEFYESIKKCFASAYGERAMAYRHTNGIDLSAVRPAVIIQQMVFGEVSGVLFTGNPLTNNTDQTLITSAYGIGEGIVSGELDSDQFVVDEHRKIIKTLLVKKEEQISFDSEKGSGSIKLPVEAALQEKESLTESDILALYDLGRKIEKEIYSGLPEDIEWCIKDKKIYILQARPITTFSHIDKSKKRTIYDNSNIIESYSGVTSPLTFSFINIAFAYTYRGFMEVLRTPERRLKKLDAVLRNLLGHIKGRVYYNMNNWYRGLQEVPGYNLNRRFMEQMMGVKSSVDIEKENTSIWQKIFIEVPLVLKALFTFLFNLKILKFKIKKFIKNFYRDITFYLKENFETYPNPKLVETYFYVLENFAKKWSTPILNDFGTMIYYGQLKKNIEKLNLKDGLTLQNDLLAGQGEIESTKPTKEIIGISNWIREDENLKKLFEQKSEKELIALILESDDKTYDTLRKKLKDYIFEWGARAMNELKLEEMTIKEDPTFLFTMIKNYLKKEKINVKEMEAREKAISTQAEKTVFSKVGFFKRRKLKKLIRKSRFHIKKREELRFMRTKVFSVVRSIITAMGKRFEKDGLIAHHRDVFYLTVNEVIELIEGRSSSQLIVKDIIELRKKEFDEYRKQESFERMYFYGDIYNNNLVEILSDEEVDMAKEEETGDPNIFRGTPCSPGFIKGKAKVVLTTEDADLNGEILVTKRTDPGWVPLFPSISGLVIERGSVLSHSAVVAREMGIPTIVGLRKITDKIQTGDLLEVDGSTGVVKKV